jgi:hypothetical protein
VLEYFVIWIEPDPPDHGGFLILFPPFLLATNANEEVLICDTKSRMNTNGTMFGMCNPEGSAYPHHVSHHHHSASHHHNLHHQSQLYGSPGEIQ